MKKKKQTIIPIIALLFVTSIHAQQDRPSTIHATSSSKKFPPRKKEIALRTEVPIGEFSSTHLLGGGIDFAFMHAEKPKTIGWALDGGISYFPGKNEKTAFYSYKYSSYFLIHTEAGLNYNTGKLNSRVLAGPAIGFYNGTTRFVFTGRAEINYRGIKPVNIGPLLRWSVEPGTRLLWTTGLKFALVL